VVEAAEQRLATRQELAALVVVEMETKMVLVQMASPTEVEAVVAVLLVITAALVGLGS
jgi:hypothetical protein